MAINVTTLEQQAVADQVQTMRRDAAAYRRRAVCASTALEFATFVSRAGALDANADRLEKRAMETRP